MTAIRRMCGGYVCVVGCVKVCTWYIWNVCVLCVMHVTLHGV